MQKVSSVFYSRESYVDNENRTIGVIGVAVKLTIDYQTEQYNITPQYDANNNDSFSFKNTSHNWKMWKAVLKAIDNAIDFANKELEITGKEEEKVWQNDTYGCADISTENL
jgi:hypothetical protein